MTRRSDGCTFAQAGVRHSVAAVVTLSGLAGMAAPPPRAVSRCEQALDRSRPRAIIAMICHGGASGPSLRTMAATPSEHGHGISQSGAGRNDRRQHRVQPVGRYGALDAEPLGARAYPPDPVAYRVGGYAQVGADCAMAAAKGAGQQRLSDDVDRIGAVRGARASSRTWVTCS